MTGKFAAEPSDVLRTDLLIIGAGPFGLSAAARAKSLGLDSIVVGRPMSFWKEHMPRGMFLRSGYEWHLDPQNERTFERFVAEKGLARSLPIPLDRFVSYADWFREAYEIRVQERQVRELERSSEGQSFVTHLEDGGRIMARTVLCAPGFWPFRNLPVEIASDGAVRIRHSAGFSDVGQFAGRRCLIVGGRQSAFETAALLAEGGAKEVTVVHRHPTPAFAESDWSWVADDLAAAESMSGWFASLHPDRRHAIERRFWEEGRLKLEPWLGRRVRTAGVSVFENSTVALNGAAGGAFRVTVLGESERTLDVDEVILATGFKVDVSRVDYLRDLLANVETDGGYPRLSPTFECRDVPGLYLVGLAAARQFGPYMGFLASCPFAARTAVDAAAGTL